MFGLIKVQYRFLYQKALTHGLNIVFGNGRFPRIGLWLFYHQYFSVCVCIYFLKYLCYSQSFLRKSKKWHTALKKKVKIVLWTIEQANQKKKIVYSFLTIRCQQCFCSPASYLCKIQGGITVTIYLFLTCIECTYSTVLLKYCSCIRMIVALHMSYTVLCLC